jgi:hypothetical protein
MSKLKLSESIKLEIPLAVAEEGLILEIKVQPKVKLEEEPLRDELMEEIEEEPLIHLLMVHLLMVLLQFLPLIHLLMVLLLV